MPIPVKKLRHAEWPPEACCFCRRGTFHWTALPTRTPGEQVACCALCAKEATAEDVPTKDVWFRRETIAHPPRRFM